MNELGAASLAVALPLFLLTTTGSATLAGVSAFSSTAVMITVQVFAGAATDRLSPDLTLRISSWTQALSCIVLGVLAATDLASFGLTVLLSSIAGAASAFGAPSEHSLIKRVVPQGQLGQAAAVSQAREATAGLIGGPIGSSLFSVAPWLAFVAEGASHLAAGVLSLRLRITRAPRPPGQGARGFMAEVYEGFTILRRHPGIRDTTVVATLANFPVAVVPFTLIAAYQESGLNNALIGLVSLSLGLGMILGSLPAARVSSRLRLGTLGIFSLGLFAVSTIAIVILHATFLVTCILLVAATISLPAFNAAIGSYTTAITPVEQVGRVVAATGVPGMILMPIAMLFAGVSFDLFGATATLAVAAGVAVGAVILAIALPGMRSIPALDALSEGLE